MSARTTALVVAVLATSCSSDDTSVMWTPLSERVQGAVLSSDLVSVPVGESVSARPTLFEDGSELGCAPTVTSNAPDVLTAETADNGAIVFTGVSPGTAKVGIFCDGHRPVFLDGAVTSPR
ncbi:MAG TPA: hypothetical protein VHU80_10140 [Polyangiaceae bacterium]|jgi:hypothetical protein|nr:hypothetical protein [Polyangiaceae bacterium]